MSFRDDIAWSSQFIPTIKEIVGPYLLTPAGLDQDLNEATDLIVLVARDMRIAARMRRPKSLTGVRYAEKYPWDFTIRARRDSGAQTEFSKIFDDGWGDWFFYGHSADSEDYISRWFLIDLHRLRTAQWRSKKPLFRMISNGDGTHFAAFDVRDLNPFKPVVLAASDQIPSVLDCP